MTNEGNGDLTQILPRTHIVIASIEKIVPTLEDVSQILRVLEQMPIQLFLTAIEPQQIDTSHWQECRMFHVEQGAVEAI